MTNNSFLEDPVNKSIFLYIGVFIFALYLGFSMAIKKPIWADEIIGQTMVINESFVRILTKDYPSLGTSNAPLFYLLQKSLCELFNYRAPSMWFQGDWHYQDSGANLFLRIIPVLCVAIAILILFIYFHRRFNLFIAFYSLLLTLSCDILMAHWAEARPYGLWALLTVCQTLIFITILERRNLPTRLRYGLFIVHCLLGLTCPLSIFQITTIYLILCIKKYLHIKDLALFIAPLAIVCFYQPNVAVNKTVFMQSIPDVLLSIFPLDWILLLLLFPLFLTINFCQSKGLGNTFSFNKQLFLSTPLFIFVLLTLLEIAAFFYLLPSNPSGQGQMVLPRHIIFIVPIGIICICYFAGLLWQNLNKPHWLKLLLCLMFILFLIHF